MAPRVSAEAFATKHRGALPPAAPTAPVQVQGIVVDSIDEWRLVTARLTSAGPAAC